MTPLAFSYDSLHLVFNSLCHSETNLGKGFLNVKSAPFASFLQRVGPFSSPFF
jgi:hypothetical protein